MEQMVVLSEMVLKYLAPTKTCKAWIKVLFNKKHTAVAYQAHLEPQNKCWPMSHTSVKWGYAAQYSVIVRPVYNTVRATNKVKINPGTNPKTEYDQGKDMIARQIYSENKSPAVFCQEQFL